MEAIKYQFVFCCILHNLLLAHDGFKADDLEEDEDFQLPGEVMDNIKKTMAPTLNRGIGAWLESDHPRVIGPEELAQEQLDDKDEWRRRVDCIVEHQAYMRKQATEL